MQTRCSRHEGSRGGFWLGRIEENLLKGWLSVTFRFCVHLPRDLLGRRDRDQEHWGQGLSVLYIAIFIGFILFLAMCTCLCWGRRTVHMSAVPVEAREGISSHGAIVTSGCEPPDNGAVLGRGLPSTGRAASALGGGVSLQPLLSLFCATQISSPTFSFWLRFYI